MVMGWGNVRLQGDLNARLRRLAEQPRTRGAAARILNNESRKIVQIAEEIALEDLHQRKDPTRRSDLSLEHGKRLHESFEMVPASEFGVGKLRVGIRNTHPAFKFVEYGTPRHDIEVRSGDGFLFFPWDGTRGVNRGAPGKKGRFAVDWDDADTFMGKKVNHPGAVARKIIPRAVRRYRRRSQRHRIS